MGSPLSLIGPAMSLAGGGKGGGGGGGGDGQGVTPQEMALAQYKMHQGELGVAAEFGNTGTGMSTMNTWATGGPRLGKALDLAGLAQQNADVTQAAAQQQAQQQGAAAGELASQGQGNQGFSSSSGNFGQTTNTTEATDATTG
jgi:hypothetical protein